MTKEELVELTLKQLSDNLDSCPDCFELFEDPEWPEANVTKTYCTIMWKFMVEIGDQNYPDPNNSPRTIIVTYSFSAKKLSCYIFFREVDSPNKAMMADAGVEITYKIPILNRSYRVFTRLRKSLIRLLKEDDNLDYLKKLNSIFPAALDHNLLD